MFDVVRSPILLCHDTLTQQCNQTREGKVDGRGSKAQQAQQFGRFGPKSTIYCTSHAQNVIVRKMATAKKFCLALKERGLRRNKDEEGAKNTMGDK